jgi:hypothetical protein
MDKANRRPSFRVDHRDERCPDRRGRAGAILHYSLAVQDDAIARIIRRCRGDITPRRLPPSLTDGGSAIVD